MSFSGCTTPVVCGCMQKAAYHPWQTTLNSFTAMGTYMCLWPNPVFGRIWNFSLWWGLCQVFKNLYDWKTIFHDYTKYLVLFPPCMSQCIGFNWHALMLISQKYKTNLASKELIVPLYNVHSGITSRVRIAFPSHGGRASSKKRHWIAN